MAFGADPAAAARRAIDVRAAVADLKGALRDLNRADTYFNSDGEPGRPSVLGGLMDFTDVLKIKPKDGRSVLDGYIARSSLADRRALIQGIMGTLNETTEGTGGVNTLRDVFYYDFVNSIRKVAGSGSKLRTQLAALFGDNVASKLIERYKLAVSRTR